jgi:hypothetical protein
MNNWKEFPVFRKNFTLFLPILVLLLAALACGGSDPVTMADIPVFTDAVQMEAGQSTMADLVADSLQQTAGQEGISTETLIYGVPAGTTWDSIKSFYSGQLGGDWTEDSELAESAEGFQTTGWTRGGLASEQALVVALVDDPLAGQSFLIVGLFSE